MWLQLTIKVFATNSLSRNHNAENIVSAYDMESTSEMCDLENTSTSSSEKLCSQAISGSRDTITGIIKWLDIGANIQSSPVMKKADNE